MKRIALFLFLLLNTSVFAQVKLARLFSDHVVLQRQKPIPVWGWAKAGEKVKVTLAQQTVQTKADASGKWIVKFNPMEAGGPHTLNVSAKSGQASVNDILIGEVWLCSGQSNMEWSVASAKDFEIEKQNANFPQIRHFKVEHNVTLQPEMDLTAGEWKIASSETVGGFSAVGFFFARELYQKLNIPIGLLHSSWGGSQVEGWISKEGMLSDDELKSYAQNLPKTWQEADIVMDAKLRKALFKSDSYTPTPEDEKKYVSGNADFSTWLKTADPVGQWDWKGLMGYRGKGYMAKEVAIPADLIGKETILSLAENDSPNKIYINGKLIGETAAKGVRKVKIPANSWKQGKNQLVIDHGNMVATPWFGPGMMGNAGNIYVEDGAAKISLAKDWLLMPSFAEKHEYAHLMNNVGTSIYNAMIVPLLPFAIRGSLWYQGEANTGRAYQYRKSFPLLINDWRRLWNDEFSFYWVQLSSYGKDESSNKGSNWAELREAQNMTLSLPKTGMAVTTDVGNPDNIHPTNKQDVAHRLATQALKNDYGQNIPYSSPLYNKVQFSDGKAIVSFKHAENGLTVKDRYGYLKGFEIAGEDKVFYYAKAEIKGNTVEVSHPKVTKPASVRYAWSDAPEEANLFSTDGFPASSFRTDDWPGISIKGKFQ
ncbi:sialate O-acetylesterase [Dyadobacter fanqingshengii]|uniref:Sialate O-acetylesterase n=1 Tax=Dyadobacter fanqingshengii TaxID=2906443 RepID=A0A9X1PCU9_9BACT|nr:sialate O-acetylesterase [Dyadobacter fanqingshengii]MCF0040917.1 sialate O-acetylesterase [Dyadobacter fanqingshengii]USJ37351.1 sialate O-acetylesterase [Dyadobacter fanqingshengii]